MRGLARRRRFREAACGHDDELLPAVLVRTRNRDVLYNAFPSAILLFLACARRPQQWMCSSRWLTTQPSSAQPSGVAAAAAAPSPCKSAAERTRGPRLLPRHALRSAAAGSCVGALRLSCSERGSSSHHRLEAPSYANSMRCDAKRFAVMRCDARRGDAIAMRCDAL